MSRYVVVFTFVVTVFFISSPTVLAKYASIVINAKTGQILYSVNANTKNYPASLTKIMTLFITFESLKKGVLRLDQRLHVSRVAESRSPSRLGLRRGQSITVENAIKALATKSANDIATVLAESIAGTERRFAKIMTRRAKAIGMKNTTFKNASGLPNRGQLSTAKDMAILARELLLQHPSMYRYFSHKTFTYKGRTHRTHNKLMSRYVGMDGIKTGYIRASGFNLVASAKRAENRIIAVVFGGKTPKSRDRHTSRLLDKGFAALGVTNHTWSKPKRISKNKDRQRKNRTVTGSYSKSYGWAIQVGAYNRYAPAHRAVTRAARAVPSLIGKEFKILKHRSKLRRGLRIYKARLIVGKKSTARNSCRALKRRKIDCMIVWMGPVS